MMQHIEQDTEPALSHGSGGPELFGGSEPRPRCLWNDTVCTEAPTHHITHPAVGDEQADARTFCLRHYVLTLAEHLEVHSKHCGETVRSHFAAHGPLGDSKH